MREEGREEGIEEGGILRQNSIALNMYYHGFSIQQIALALNESEDDVEDVLLGNGIQL